MIGVFDSGIGGLSVLREIETLLPAYSSLYMADQAHLPYGRQLPSQIRTWSAGIVRFLLDQGAELIVVACNTATAAALDHLRNQFPQTPFVGMEPAVKPGATATRTGRVGVLATAGTFDSQRYARLMQQYAQGVIVLEDPCHGLVNLIESNRQDSTGINQLLEQAIAPMLASGVDVLVLGCTHYPFVIDRIQAIAGPDVTIIDPAPAVARQTKRLLQEFHIDPPSLRLPSQAFTSASPIYLQQQMTSLLGRSFPTRPVQWQNNAVRL